LASLSGFMVRKCLELVSGLRFVSVSLNITAVGSGRKAQGKVRARRFTSRCLVRSMSAADSNQSQDILQSLKRCTAQIHERVEQRLQIFSPEFDLPAYIHLLTRFYGFWAPVEKELTRVTELNDPSLALETRLKSHLLEADLRVFGIDPADVPVCSSLPDVRTFHKSLGCLYVFEGSTLGAQFIARHISARFDIHEGSGASFFNAYGAAVAERWSDFRTFVRSRAGSEKVDEMQTGARETFEALDVWLSLP